MLRIGKVRYAKGWPTPVPTLARLPTVTPPRPTVTPFPTIAPLVPTATPQAANLLVAIVIRNANIRNGPGTTFEIIGIANEGSQVALRGTRDDWYAITTADGLEGWMSGVVLEIDPQTAEAVPVDSP
jgi:SH3-like domain-containing protein